MIISSKAANEIYADIEHLTDGGGVTAPDDMVSIDDVSDVLVEFTSAHANVDYHAQLCEELTMLYQSKNADYGNSFGKGMETYGMAMPVIRLEDKLNLVKSLTKNGTKHVKDESLRDTLMDLANYAIMTVVEMERDNWQ